MIWFKCFCAGKAFVDHGFNGINKVFCCNRVLKADADIIHDFVKVILKERQNTYAMAHYFAPQTR